MSETITTDVQPQTKQLARFLAELKFQDIPVKTVEHVKRCLLDAFGCALYGMHLPWTVKTLDTVRALGEGATSRVWGGTEKLSPTNAALVNGTATHAYELDDLHKRAIIHPGGVTIPSVLAAVELRGVDGFSGRDVITAVAAGYEASIRVGMASGLGLLHRGWHNNPVLGTFGGAVGAGRILGLDSRQMEHAIGMAATFAGGLMAAQYGSMVKRLHAGRAAQSGLYAALLAANDFTGIEDVFELGYGGYLQTFVDESDPPQLTKDLGTVWETDAVGFKLYSACGSSHTTVDALLDIRQNDGVRAEDVERIQVMASTATRDHVGWAYAPDSQTTAQMNLSYSAAVAMLDGAAFVDQYLPERLRDPRILALTSRVVVDADPEIDRKGRDYRHEVRVTVETRDGKTHSRNVVHAKGSEHAPVSDDELHAKFRRLASEAFASQQVERLESAVSELDSSPASRLFKALEGHG